MNIDFYNEIRYQLSLFYPLFRKKHLSQSDVEQMIVIINDIQQLLDTYLYDYMDY